MAEEHTLFEVTDGVAVITLNRPRVLNALLMEQAQYLAELFENISNMADVRAVLITGAGGAFCSGVDIMDSQRKPEEPVSRAELMTAMSAFGRLAIAQFKLGCPIVAAIQGVASGVGLAIAVACDRRFADGSARMGAVWMKRGFHPDGGITYTLPRLVGVSNALHMLATGELFTAKKALKIGLIDELVEEGDVVDAALNYARQLATGPSVMMGLARRAVYTGLDGTLEDAIMREAWGISVAPKTEDAKEGFRAWIKKRPTEFTGL
ncbi:MAG: enoyl-CoA hydratase/isomerase family protein [Proteobacteria bacterium]|nr:enoyl-CoA hydratase/isomerase family protein [Pseudomonadota bacterium]